MRPQQTCKHIQPAVRQFASCWNPDSNTVWDCRASKKSFTRLLIMSQTKVIASSTRSGNYFLTIANSYYNICQQNSLPNWSSGNLPAAGTPTQKHSVGFSSIKDRQLLIISQTKVIASSTRSGNYYLSIASSYYNIYWQNNSPNWYISPADIITPILPRVSANT